MFVLYDAVLHRLFPSSLPVYLFYSCVRRVGTLFCMNPELYEDSDDEEGTDDLIVRQAEGARIGGRMLCALTRCVCLSYPEE